MKIKQKKELNAIVDGMLKDYNTASQPDEKGKALASLIKGVNVIKEVENQEIDNQIKRKKIKLDEEKLELEKKRMILEEERLKIDQDKVNMEKDKMNTDQDKFSITTENDIRKLELEDSKLDFEKKKFNVELKRTKTDKIISNVLKGLEIGVPVIIYGGLSVLALKATYKDDVRVPSETWSFIRSVFKK
jgi:membrane-associated HD superfamily phosphohydrolase